MHQTVDKQLIKTDEETKPGNAGDHAFEDITYLIQHEVALQPVRDVACGFVSTALGHRTVLTQLQHLFHRIMVATRFRGVAFMALLLRQQILNHPVQGEIRVTTDRRGEVCIRLQRKTKVTAVFRIVNRLLH